MARQSNPNLQALLLEAALTVFAERGLLAAKISDITDLAGVSKGAFYLQFESKEALYEQMCRGFIADLVEYLAQHGRVTCGTEAIDMRLVAQLADSDEALLDWLWQRRGQRVRPWRTWATSSSTRSRTRCARTSCGCTISPA
jgi:AcrR family transcriptional regulator